MLCKKIMMLTLVVLLLAGCGLKQGVIEKAPRSYLWFTGDMTAVVVYIDDLAPLTFAEQNSTETVYHELSPGKHTIVVKRSGKEIVNRTVLLGNGTTKEIRIP